MWNHDYSLSLDDDRLDWVRVRFHTEGQTVTRFAVQYETTIDGKRVPVVRYDAAHGFAHRDLLNRRGDVIDKQPLAGTYDEALTFGVQDVQANWQDYREAFFRGTP
jgi:hypothetical protein